jgi:hypothetical protein
VVSFWKEHPEWADRRPNTQRPAPRCKAHGVEKVRSTGKSRYRCVECEREEWEREGTPTGLQHDARPLRDVWSRQGLEGRQPACHGRVLDVLPP